jgi:hypothetical protein
LKQGLEVMTMTNKESKAEIKRLRAALEVYAQACYSNGGHGDVDQCHAEQCCGPAFRALNAKPSA